MNLHFWWEKIMPHLSTSLFQWVVCCSIHGLSPNKRPYWLSAFQIEECITQYFYIKLTNSVQNLTPLLGRHLSLETSIEGEFTRRRTRHRLQDNEQLLQQLKTGLSGSSTSLYSFNWHFHTLYMDCTWKETGSQSKQRVSLLQLHCILTSPSCKCIVGTIELFINVTFPSLSPSDLCLPSKLWTHIPLWVSGIAVVAFLLPLLVYYTRCYSIFDFVTKGRYKSELTAQIFLSEVLTWQKDRVWA